jgi:hypothetical protein
MARSPAPGAVLRGRRTRYRPERVLTQPAASLTDLALGLVAVVPAVRPAVNRRSLALEDIAA